MAMEIVIAPATEADAEAISALNREVQGVHATALPGLFKPPGPESFPPSAVGELLAKPENVLLLARVGSEPAGYVYAQIIRRSETSLRYAHAMIYLHHISVAAAFRKLGVGRALVEAVRQIGAGHGISTLALDVWSFNEPARRFFRRCGLTPYNERLWIE
jgi:ribosomal protein S18 acetylase RimI-like enzyme